MDKSKEPEKYQKSETTLYLEDLAAMRKFSETYAKRTGTFFCIEPIVTAMVVEGLALNKYDYGAPLCPCRNYDDKKAEIESAYWNCPCVPMRERKECHCMLFLTPENDFASSTQDFQFKPDRLPLNPKSRSNKSKSL